MSQRRPARTAVPTIAVDPALRRFFDQHMARITRATKEDASAFDARWEAALAIVDHEPPAYVVGGYKSDADFLRRAMHEEPRTGFRNMRVAKYASPRDEATFGATKLDAAIAYVEAKHGPLKGRLPIAFSSLVIPVVDQGKKRRKSLADATVAEVLRAAKALRPALKKKPTPAESALSAALLREKLHDQIELHVHDGFATFSRVPLGRFAQFVKALRSAKWDEPVLAKARRKPRTHLVPRAGSGAVPTRRSGTVPFLREQN
jgi:hypothetical protein